MVDVLVELCAGTAALSWATAGLKFPVSRMGSKSGYAYAILSALGLRAGEPLPAYLWNEPDEELALTPRHSWPARDALPGQSSLFGPRS